MARVSHTASAKLLQPRLAEVLESALRRMKRARLYYGHGTDNALDDAMAMLECAVKAEEPLTRVAMRRRITRAEEDRFHDLIKARIVDRVPVVYLTHSCWFAGLPIYVDARALIPRSPIAELIENLFSPWVRYPERVRMIADIGTGSGCIAVACALAFPEATVDAVDISPDALEVARINRRRLKLTKRVRLVESNYFERLKRRRYDIIVSNPPYVGKAEYQRLPAEYAHEPAGALLSGKDGMDGVRIILQQAVRHLTSDGVLVVEVGNTETRVRREFKKLPFTWLSFERGGGGVFLLTSAQLRAAQEQGLL
jgi:ribosomal protein L3 glutamine methyltransferase